MTDKPIAYTGYDRADAYFHQKDSDMLARRRAELDAQRTDCNTGKMKCPRCGSEMNEVTVEHVKLDSCTGCGGIFLDKGELEILTHANAGGLCQRFFR
jgi:hypothetical protein